MKVSRRDVLKAMAVVASGMAINHVGRTLRTTAAKGNDTNLASEVFIPLVSNKSSRSKVPGNGRGPGGGRYPDQVWPARWIRFGTCPEERF